MGAWSIASSLEELESGSYVPTGLEQVTVEFERIDPKLTAGLAVFDVQSSEIQVPDLGIAATPFPLLGGSKGEWISFGGLYYYPATDVTVELSSGTSIAVTYDDEMNLDCSAFQTFVEFATYEGNVIIEVEIEPGVFVWEVDPGATEVCRGILRLQASQVAPVEVAPSSDMCQRVDGVLRAGPVLVRIGGVLDAMAGTLTLSLGKRTSDTTFPAVVELSPRNSANWSGRAIAQSGAQIAASLALRPGGRWHGELALIDAGGRACAADLMVRVSATQE